VITMQFFMKYFKSIYIYVSFLPAKAETANIIYY